MKRSAAARRFRIRVEPRPSAPKVWPTATVTVLEGDEPVGTYERNYAAFAETTFEPFEWNGAWYALYSPQYTATRVLALPECRDIGGETDNGNGFCPVEFYVPRFRPVRGWLDGRDEATGHDFRSFESDGDAIPEGVSQTGEGRHASHQRAGGWQNLDTAFIAGCHWGDDRSWKLQAIDLRRAAEGVVVREERFGFIELAPLPLVEAVRVSSFLDSGTRITILRQEERDVASGALIDPYE